MSHRRTHKLLNILLVFMLTLSLSSTVLAQGGDGGSQFNVEAVSVDDSFSVDIDGKAPQPAPQDNVSVIVKLDLAPLTGYGGEIVGLDATRPDAVGAGRLDVTSAASQSYLAYANAQINAFASELVAAIPGAAVTYRYPVIIGGAAVVIPAGQVAQLSKLPGVKAVYPDRLEKLTTEVTPEFIGATKIWEALGGQGSAGEGMVVGVLDTGIWPEHPSFADPDPAGKAYVRPAHWHGAVCEFGSANPVDTTFVCNNKLVGADRFMATYDLLNQLLPGEFKSARDDDGHGTHTSSTAAGNGGVAASLLGVDRGVVSGIAPRAAVAMYKVCGELGCYNTDSAAAIQQAIVDGVDAINFSISGGSSPFDDVVSLAFLDAYNAGVFVAASAGNSGPGADTTDHREPWVTTVAASTSNRHFISTLTLTSSDGASLVVQGASVTAGVSTATPVVNAADFDGLPAGNSAKGMCNTIFPAGTFSGQIVLCKRGVVARVEKGYNVWVGGAGGMILYNPAQQGLVTDNHFLPSVHIDGAEGAQVMSFFTSHPGVTATFSNGIATAVPGDMMASFSSRGGSGQTLGISKPDVTAPGVQILAGNTPYPATVLGGTPSQLFQAIQGTSMSSPHVAGAGALLKALHPDWTPAQIKSALMTTAKTAVVKEDGSTPANAFDYGSGRIDLTKAGNPGLTFRATAQDYINHAQDLWNSNYPSLYVPALAGKITVQRTVTSETSGLRIWQVEVVAPADLKVTAPAKLMLAGGGSATFDISVDASTVPVGQVRMAVLKLTSEDLEAHFPITIVRRSPAVSLSKTCDPSMVYQGDVTHCHIDITNTLSAEAMVNAVDYLPKQLTLDAASVEGAVAQGNGLSYTGKLYGATPPDVAVVDGTGTTVAGYLPLAGLGVGPLASFSDDSIVNLNVPAFVFGGENWTRIGVVSNGYVVVGGGVSADVSARGQSLPNPQPPNNVLAPFWTDLNPAAGGIIRGAILRSGSDRWLVIEWDQVANFTDNKLNSFQLWIGLNGVEDISYTYGDVTSGNKDLLAVGAENKFGNRGSNWYYNGVGAAVANGDELRVRSAAAESGETRRIQYVARGERLGAWTNVVEMTSTAFAGAATAMVSGEVVQKPPQPVTVQLPLLADAWVNGGDKGANYNDYPAVVARSTGVDNALFVWDVSGLPAGAQIQSAQLVVDVSLVSGYQKSLFPLNVGAFDPATVTFNSKLTYSNPGAGAPAAVGAMTLDVTAQAGKMMAEAVNGKGYLAVGAAGYPGRVSMKSLESYGNSGAARLMITYLPAP